MSPPPALPRYSRTETPRRARRPMSVLGRSRGGDVDDAVTSAVTDWRYAAPTPQMLASTVLFDPPRLHHHHRPDTCQAFFVFGSGRRFVPLLRLREVRFD